MHTWPKTTQVEFPGIIKSQYLTAIVNSIAKVIDDLAELV
jgi:hypothetical protein